MTLEKNTHSRLGIISFALFFAPSVCISANATIGLLVGEEQCYDFFRSPAGIGGLAALSIMPIVGTVLGLVAMFIPDTNRTFGIMGTALNCSLAVVCGILFRNLTVRPGWMSYWM